MTKPNVLERHRQTQIDRRRKDHTALGKELRRAYAGLTNARRVAEVMFGENSEYAATLKAALEMVSALAWRSLDAEYSREGHQGASPYML
jgi:hypothetical protein